MEEVSKIKIDSNDGLEGIEEIYGVTRDGRVWNFLEKKWLLSKKTHQGYITVYVKKNGWWKSFRVHRLVASTFLPNSFRYPYVNHKNGIKTDNRVENLEWCSISQNCRHAIALGLKKPLRGEAVTNSKLKTKDVIEMREKYATGIFTYKDLAPSYNICWEHVRDVIRKKRWKHI